MLIYADTANLAEIERLNDDERIAGFTTNPTLFRHEGVEYALEHAKKIVALTDKPVSIDGPLDLVCDLGEHVIPKIVVPLHADPALPDDRPANLTAICCQKQLGRAASTCRTGDICSIFAGRIADTGRHPTRYVEQARDFLTCRILWASAREALNVRDAEDAGADIITLTPDLIRKLDQFEWDLEQVAQVTIDQFEQDARMVQW